MKTQCEDEDVDAGRCQLEADHEGVHASAGADVYCTWYRDELLAWSLYRPPFWMHGLSWHDTHRPVHRADWAS